MSKKTLVIAGLVALGAVTFGVAQFSSPESDADIAKAARRALRHMGGGQYAISKTPSEFLETTDTVVRLKVTAIEGPMWNSNDGREWRGNETTGILIFSRVRGEVEEVLLGEPVSSPLELLALGDASVRYEGENVPDMARISGGFVVGKSFVVLLERFRFPMEDGPVMRWTLARDYQGNWRIEGSQAYGGDTSRSMSVTALRKFLSDNWQASRQAK